MFVATVEERSPVSNCFQNVLGKRAGSGSAKSPCAKCLSPFDKEGYELGEEYGKCERCKVEQTRVAVVLQIFVVRVLHDPRVDQPRVADMLQLRTV